MRSACTLFITFSTCVYQVACIKLKPCDHLTPGTTKRQNADKWFKWGQLYSFCIQNYDNVTQGNMSAFDHGCSTLGCKECISVCYLPTGNQTLHACEQGCKSGICKSGCQFYHYIFNKTGNFSRNETNLPYLNHPVVQEKQNNDNVEFTWTPVKSYGDRKLSSIYLITIQATIRSGKRN